MQPTRSAAARRRGFTLAEMLVVVGIILLVMALALPAFTVIVSSRSVESARNIVASTIVRARGEAIRRGQPCGVYFYVDPDTGRSGAALVTIDPLSDPDPYHEYQLFTRGNATVQRDYQGGSYDPLNFDTVTTGTPPDNEPAMTSDRVVVLGGDGDPAGPPDDPGTAQAENTYPAGYAAFNGRPIVVTLRHTSQDTDVSTTQNDNPGLSNPGDTTNETAPQNQLVTSLDPSTMVSDFWKFDADIGVPDLAEIGSLELISGIEPVLLPPGASLQVILGETLEDTAADSTGDVEDGLGYAVKDDGATDPDDDAFLERYARSGLILFDAEGHLIQAPYRIYASSRLGRRMGLDLVPDPDSPPARIQQYFVDTTVMGLVIYEKDAFESAAGDGTALVWRGGLIASMADPTTPLDDFQPTEGDVTFLYPPNRRPQNLATPTRPDYRFDEYAEERWLDANAIPLMVNRYSGTLVEGE
jgi:prepilin-type N-terminal cleavage/methylation domain-containing protein